MTDKTLTDVVSAIKALEIAVLSLNPDAHIPIREYKERQQRTERRARASMVTAIASAAIATLALLVSAAQVAIPALTRSAPIFE